jgi:hypothetical protein
VQLYRVAIVLREPRGLWLKRSAGGGPSFVAPTFDYQGWRRADFPPEAQAIDAIFGWVPPEFRSVEVARVPVPELDEPVMVFVGTGPEEIEPWEYLGLELVGPDVDVREIIDATADAPTIAALQGLLLHGDIHDPTPDLSRWPVIHVIERAVVDGEDRPVPGPAGEVQWTDRYDVRLPDGERGPLDVDLDVALAWARRRCPVVLLERKGERWDAGTDASDGRPARWRG